MEPGAAEPLRLLPYLLVLVLALAGMDVLLILSIGTVVNLLIGLVNTFSPGRFGWVNLICATLLMYALGRIHGKKEALEKERLLHE